MIITAQGEPLSELTKEGFCIVDFFSDTCGPCKMLAPLLARVESECPFLTLVKVNLSAHPEYGSIHDVKAVPTLMYINEGELKERTVGFMPADAIKERIARYLYQ